MRMRHYFAAVYPNGSQYEQREVLAFTSRASRNAFVVNRITDNPYLSYFRSALSAREVTKRERDNIIWMSDGRGMPTGRFRPLNFKRVRRP